MQERIGENIVMHSWIEINASLCRTCTQALPIQAFRLGRLRRVRPKGGLAVPCETCRADARTSEAWVTPFGIRTLKTKVLIIPSSAPSQPYEIFKKFLHGIRRRSLGLFYFIVVTCKIHADHNEKKK